MWISIIMEGAVDFVGWKMVLNEFSRVGVLFFFLWDAGIMCDDVWQIFFTLNLCNCNISLVQYVHGFGIIVWLFLRKY